MLYLCQHHTSISLSLCTVSVIAPAIPDTVCFCSDCDGPAVAFCSLLHMPSSATSARASPTMTATRVVAGMTHGTKIRVIRTLASRIHATAGEGCQVQMKARMNDGVQGCS
eukprot:GHUV01026106.1.p1 GENE.GHUV01026106.1~~GHUV01026106.1.p1  ORF type:complete len:111 (-),score=0.98 GHUV01026106.1:97-429(-)